MFDSQFYLDKYNDISRAVRIGTVTTPLAHFMKYGAKENRLPSAAIDLNGLLKKDPSLAEKIEETGVRGVFGHLLASGRILGRGLAAQ